MARGLMEVINISPGQPVYVEDYRMQDQGLEWNAQNELDYRTEYLMTNRVVMEEISSEALWGLTGWTPANSLEITQVTGNLVCDVGMSSIGGRRHVRTSSGNITPTGTAGDNTYWIRVKYDTSSDTHTFVGEPTSSPPQADTSTDKRVTLATAVKSGGSWTGTPVDKRTSNTQLTPPAVISGNAGSNPVLSLHQEGSGLGLLVTGGDLQVGDATYNQQLIVYGTSTFGVTIYDNPGGYSVEMIAGAANTLKVQTIGGTAATITAANITAIGGPTISSTGIDMNTDAITNAGLINGLSITTGTISTGVWQGTAINSTYLTDVSQPLHAASSPTFVGITLSGAIATPTTITTSSYINCGGDLTAANIVTAGNVDGIDVSSHAANNDAHHVAYTDAKVLVVVDEHLALESTNATWINCPYEGTVPASDEMDGSGSIRPQGSGRIIFTVPLPTTRGGKGLYINGTRVSLAAADGSNYLNFTYIYGMGATTMTELDSDPTNKNSVNLWEDTSMNADCSAYGTIKIATSPIIGTPDNLKIQYITVRYYYA